MTDPSLGQMDASDPWVRDTRFGAWLITSDLWVNFVMRVALGQLVVLLGRRRRRYDVILDVGCGGGGALPLLERRFAPRTLVAVDPDPEMIARAGAAAARCRCRVELKIGQATKLDVPDDSLDMIFCHQTFHHVAEPERAAREFYRVLKPGGVLLFSESCAPFIRSVPVRVLFRHPMQAQRLAEEYLALLSATGFAFSREHVSTPYPWWSRPDLGLLEWLGRSLPTPRPETVVNVTAFKVAAPPESGCAEPSWRTPREDLTRPQTVHVSSGIDPAADSHPKVTPSPLISTPSDLTS